MTMTTTAAGGGGGSRDTHPTKSGSMTTTTTTKAATATATANNYEDEMPQSVEEAGALLGAALLRYTVPVSLTPPPKGMHSGFATFGRISSTDQRESKNNGSGGTISRRCFGSVPSSELFHRLAQLRSLLRSAPTDEPLVAAPSLLAGVLMKLLAISSQMAVGGGGSGSGGTGLGGGVTSSLSSSLSSTPSTVDISQKRTAVPPMLSTPIRRVWVECVVLCHSLGDGLSGNARINLFGFVRDMIVLAGLNPRTAKAQGGTRVAALQVISCLFEDPKLSKQLSSWAFDVVQLCQRSLKSSGTGEPTYRIAAVETACSVAIACRTAFLKARSIDEKSSAGLLLKSALEDRAIIEMVKLLKVGVQDKVPEVRSATARLAGLIAPMVIHINVKSSNPSSDAAATPTTSLEDVMTLAFKNLDDESVDVAGRWAEALARCMSTSIEYQSQIGNSESNGGGVTGSSAAGSSARAGRKGILPASACNTLPKALKYLVSVFVKVGGEWTAPRAGGHFSVGGRAVRVGFARAIIQMLRLQSSIQALGDGRSMSYKEAILIILSMVGNDMDAQLHDRNSGGALAGYLDATTVLTSRTTASISGAAAAQSGRALFQQGPKVAPADACVARSLTSLVFREGLSVLVAETTQLAILHDLINLCSNKQDALKGDQFQVLLIELSHLFTALGEAAASSLEDIIGALKGALKNSNHGVRHEAAVACAAITSVFPPEGYKLLRDIIDAMQVQHAELMSITSPQTTIESTNPLAAGRFLFGRSPQVKSEVRIDETLKHQYGIHGMALAVCMIIRDLPTLSGGMPLDMIDDVISVSEIFINTIANETLKNSSPSGVCTCVRAGLGILSGVLTIGPKAVANHIAGIFGIWQKVSKATPANKNFTAEHEMICLEAMLTSIVTFLKFCSELLLSIPDALSRTSLLLESILPLFFEKGRLGALPNNPLAVSRLESAKASILEAFAWMPPGSYPMVADSVFGFAAFHIQAAIANDVPCSLLPSLISKEDTILDAVPFSMSSRLGQTGGAMDLETDITTRTSFAAEHGDRESAFSCLGKPGKSPTSSMDRQLYVGSEALALLINASKSQPPTVLHEVGTWRMPVDPSSSPPIRLVDAAIQTFAATFGLKSGKDQQNAVAILQSLLPPTYFQNIRLEQDRSGKNKDNLTAEKNIVAVLLSCVMTLPLDESTHDIPIGLGPTWMKSASSIFLSLLPSPLEEVRRAAAEGLGYLATLGVKEDMHFLQSSVTHSLDEIIAGVQHQNQLRAASQDSILSGRSAGLLTLACMQRNTFQFAERRANKSRLRGSPGGMKQVDSDVFPTLQILIRLLPFTSGQSNMEVSLSSRSAAIYALFLLLRYSGKFERLDLNNLQLLKKATEIVEDSFLSAWTIASQSIGETGDFLYSTYSFLAVLVRLMTFLTPYLYHIEEVDPGVAVRFSTISTIIMEYAKQHPVIQLETMAFFEVLSQHQTLLPPHSGGLKYFEHPILCSIPYLMANITPQRSLVLSHGVWFSPSCTCSSSICLRGAVSVLRVISLSGILVTEWSDMKVISLLLASLEVNVGSITFPKDKVFRNLAAAREIEGLSRVGDMPTKELSDSLRFLLYLEQATSENCEAVLLRYILLARSLLAGVSRRTDEDDNVQSDNISISEVVEAAQIRANRDLHPLLDTVNTSRWQVKCLAAQLSTFALAGIADKYRKQGQKLVDSASFNPRLARNRCAQECRDANRNGDAIPKSILSLHVGEVLSSACVASTATVDQVELRILQVNAMHCLSEILQYFGNIPDPDQAGTSLLNDFIPQISASLKSALVAHQEQMDDRTCRLFWVGCEALRFFIQARVTDDLGVIKRIIRPALFAKKDVPMFSIDEQTTGILQIGDDDDDHLRSSLLLHLGKALTVGMIPSNVSSLLEPDEASVGAHCAALAIDGANLLLSRNSSLCGRDHLSAKSEMRDAQDATFFFFSDPIEVSDDAASALACSWAFCAQIASAYLSRALKSREIAATVQNQCRSWLKVLVPYLFLGLDESTRAMSMGGNNDSETSWANIDVEEVASCCLGGIRTIACDPRTVEIGEGWQEKIEGILVSIYKKVVVPILLQDGGDKSTMDGEAMSNLIANFCDVLTTLTSTFSTPEGSQLLVAILDPLNLMQTEKLDLQHESTSSVVAACLGAVADIVRNGTSSPSLVKAMLGLLTSISEQKNKLSPLPPNVRSSSFVLLEQCLKHESLAISECSSITASFAVSKDWEAWCVAASLRDGASVERSLLDVESVLLNPLNIEEQLDALVAVRKVVQASPLPNPLVGRVVSALGAEIIAIFRAYAVVGADSSSAIRSRRAGACADSIKILVAAYQQFLADASDEENSEFLVLLFDAFIVALRFNGLPNHPPPQGSMSEPTIGQMCAQTITYTARTSPLPFKSAMGLVKDEDRALLEFAVRADMNGYVVASQPTQVKKKISLQGFKK